MKSPHLALALLITNCILVSPCYGAPARGSSIAEAAPLRNAAKLNSPPGSGAGDFAATASAGKLGRSLLSGDPATGANPSFRWAALFTLLAFLPACFVTLTPFLRISVVLHFLRQALGTQSVPSNQVILGLSMFLTLAFMQPVLLNIYSESVQPYEEGRISGELAWTNASSRIKAFLLPFTKEKEIQLMVSLAKAPVPRNAAELDLRVVAPAYILSELQASFKIGVALFLPFLVLDLVAASITLALGMVQLPPVMISAPFKILLFVLVDGWSLVIGSLMRSFQP
jgi:flagellar biosynthesis protein FliP